MLKLNRFNAMYDIVAVVAVEVTSSHLESLTKMLT